MTWDCDSYGLERQFARLPGEELLEALAEPIRWATLATLLEGESPGSAADLAREVATRATDDQRGDEQLSIERVRHELRHVHLPALVGADLVSYDRSGGRVAPGEDADRVAEFVTGHDEFPEVLPVLADPCGRAALAVLATRDESLSLERLGRSIREDGAVDRSLETILIELHHRHLPTLGSLAFVEYDPATRTVTPLPKTDDLRFVADE